MRAMTFNKLFDANAGRTKTAAEIKDIKCKNALVAASPLSESIKGALRVRVEDGIDEATLKAVIQKLSDQDKRAEQFFVKLFQSLGKKNKLELSVFLGVTQGILTGQQKAIDRALRGLNAKQKKLAADFLDRFCNIIKKDLEVTIPTIFA
jgi:hypothetical protein